MGRGPDCQVKFGFWKTFFGARGGGGGEGGGGCHTKCDSKISLALVVGTQNILAYVWVEK